MAAPSGFDQFATQSIDIVPLLPPLFPNTPHLILDLDIRHAMSFRLTEPLVKVGERVLAGLQELDELLKSSCSEQKPTDNESAPDQAAFQPLVEPVPQLTVSTDVLRYCKAPGANLVRALLKFMWKFRTKVQVTFSRPTDSQGLLETAVSYEFPDLAKLVLAVEPHRMTNNSCFCCAMVVAKVMKCASMGGVLYVPVRDMPRCTTTFDPNCSKSVFK
jgi:hypothetical protein